MLKLEDLKKLKNEKLLTITIEMEQMLAVGVWSAEFEMHLTKLQRLMNLFFDAQTTDKKVPEDAIVTDVQKIAEQSYRRFYLYLKSLALEDKEVVKNEAKRMLKRIKLTPYEFERQKQATQVQHLLEVVTTTTITMQGLLKEEPGCTELYEKLITNTDKYKNAMQRRVLHEIESKKSLSPTKLRPQLIKAIRHFYIYISISNDEANEKLRMQQLKDMERIARKGVKRKYVRKNTINVDNASDKVVGEELI